VGAIRAFLSPAGAAQAWIILPKTHASNSEVFVALLKCVCAMSWLASNVPKSVRVDPDLSKGIACRAKLLGAEGHGHAAS
jgi:hypothetical protein